MTCYEHAHLWIEFVDADPFRAHVDYFAASGWKREDLGKLFSWDATNLAICHLGEAGFELVSFGVGGTNNLWFKRVVRG